MQTPTFEEEGYTVADFDVPPEMDAPPDEEMTGGNVYFDAGFVPKKAVAPTPKTEPIVAPSMPAPKTVTTASSAPRSVKPAVKGDAKGTFGSFLRSIRKIAKSGVLLTLCMDLDSEYDGETFVLQTTSDTIYRSLSKPEHADLINKAFEEIGLEAGAYEIRLKGKQADGFNKSVAEIKETFGGVKVEIK